MEILQQALWCQMKKISSRIWFSSRSSGVLPAPILFRVDFRGLSRRVLWFQAPDSLEAWGWGLGADFGLRDWTRSNRDVSYREVSCWNDDVVVLASLFWLPVVIGDVEASFLTPVIVPLWGSYVSFFLTCPQGIVFSMWLKPTCLLLPFVLSTVRGLLVPFDGWRCSKKPAITFWL